MHKFWFFMYNLFSSWNAFRPVWPAGLKWSVRPGPCAFLIWSLIEFRAFIFFGEILNSFVCYLTWLSGCPANLTLACDRWLRKGPTIKILQFPNTRCLDGWDFSNLKSKFEHYKRKNSSRSSCFQCTIFVNN